MRWAASQAQASIGVSAALVERMRALSVCDADRLHVMRNGVDTHRFQMQAPRCGAPRPVDG
jgi:teichuronic acid biosynthesis glycosyltransferase TuaC